MVTLYLKNKAKDIQKYLYFKKKQHYLHFKWLFKSLQALISQMTKENKGLEG